MIRQSCESPLNNEPCQSDDRGSSGGKGLGRRGADVVVVVVVCVEDRSSGGGRASSGLGSGGRSTSSGLGSGGRSTSSGLGGGGRRTSSGGATRCIGGDCGGSGGGGRSGTVRFGGILERLGQEGLRGLPAPHVRAEVVPVPLHVSVPVGEAMNDVAVTGVFPRGVPLLHGLLEVLDVGRGVVVTPRLDVHPGMNGGRIVPRARQLRDQSPVEGHDPPHVGLARDGVVHDSRAAEAVPDHADLVGVDPGVFLGGLHGRLHPLHE
mmetsp:Transcript_4621/g.12986  ORF Transcript_4621/g.12986 Transcript_4621/m.12986 type:complete len:264 (+) Transcript_4621:487-1278(+)